MGLFSGISGFLGRIKKKYVDPVIDWFKGHKEQVKQLTDDILPNVIPQDWRPGYEENRDKVKKLINKGEEIYNRFNTMTTAQRPR